MESIEIHRRLTKVNLDEVITQTREAYDSVTTTLAEHGTEIARRRILETDADIAPHKFIREAVHDFIFPSQQTIERVDRSRIIDPTEGHSLAKEEFYCAYRPELIKGAIRISYNDAGDRAILSVIDLLGKSELPDSVTDALTQRTQPLLDKS